ncbi:MAG TPA: HNH endonuclease signature motif containing protein [Planctomycetaceae bacterium]|nr:HNH endonuclease signature motif containing protein [Planctomycetaceae bacterium]
MFPAAHAWLPFQIDHVVAEKHGGETVAENLALSCYYCNSFKGPNIAGIDPIGEPDVAVQLFHPRKDRWADHFEWNGALLFGKSATGRATIAVLRINDPEAVECRQLLIETERRF